MEMLKDDFENANVQPHALYTVYEKQLF
jgi:hypothetical protein